MSYPDLPDRRISYEDDGTVGFYGKTTGEDSEISNADLIELNNPDSVMVGPERADYETWTPMIFFFFPELRVMGGIGGTFIDDYGGTHNPLAIATVEGSPDSTNGLDGSWTSATFSSGSPSASLASDAWRAGVKAMTFAAPIKVLRITPTGTGHGIGYARLHLYGHKATGQTPNDLIFLDYDEGGAEFVRDEDFGDSPRGTTSVRTLKIKNTSTTLTANGITLTLDDADYALSFSNEGPWSSTLSIASLGTGVSSAVVYVRHTTPDPGVGVLGPRAPKLTATATSWS
jgi:hypothetical protein